MNPFITADIVSYEGSTDGLRFGRLRLRGPGIPANASRHFALDRLNNTLRLHRISDTIDGPRDIVPDSEPDHLEAAMKAVARWEGMAR